MQLPMGYHNYTKLFLMRFQGTDIISGGSQQIHET